MKKTTRLLLYSWKKSVPVLMGYVVLGIAFGILAQQAGYGWPWALLMSVIIYAGSMQFALVPLMSALTPLPTIALMTALINSRHLFYGLSFVKPYRESGAKYPYLVFSLSDETYSVLISCKDDPELAERNHTAMLLISMFHQCYWILGSLIGSIAGELIPAKYTDGIDFSMTALFIVILVDQIRSGGRDTRICAMIGALFGVLFLLLLGSGNFLLPTLACTVIALILYDNFAKGGVRA